MIVWSYLQWTPRQTGLTFEYVKNVSTGFSLLHFHSLVHSVQVELVILSYASANFDFKVQLICRTRNPCMIKTDYTLKVHSGNVLTLIYIYIFNQIRALNFKSVTEIICRSFKSSYWLKVNTKSKFYQLYWNAHSQLRHGTHVQAKQAIFTT